MPTVSGTIWCIPNIHLHLYLKKCLKDYGPVHGFWCYPCERYNGLISGLHTNGQNVEVQLMKKLLRQRDIQVFDLPQQAEGLWNRGDHLVGSLNENSFEINEQLMKLQALCAPHNFHSDYCIKCPDIIKLIPPLYKGVLNSQETQKLKTIYSYIYTDINIVYFSPFQETSAKCVMGGEVFTTSTVITAFWPSKSCSVPLQNNVQVGTIQNFSQHSIKVRRNDAIVELSHIFCLMKWYINHGTMVLLLL